MNGIDRGEVEASHGGGDVTLQPILGSPNDRETSTDDLAAARIAYVNLQHKVADAQRELELLGRMDVPLDDPTHITNAGDPDRQLRWLAQYRRFAQLEVEQEQAWSHWQALLRADAR